MIMGSPLISPLTYPFFFFPLFLFLEGWGVQPHCNPDFRLQSPGQHMQYCENGIRTMKLEKMKAAGNPGCFADMGKAHDQFH